VSGVPTTVYRYRVRDRGGNLVSGTLEAGTPEAAVSRLRGMGYTPVSVQRADSGLSREISLPGFGGRVGLKDLAVLSRQFATMIDSGLSLIRALSILAEQTENKVLAGVVAELRTDVESGEALSTAMAKHPKVFPPLMVNMVKAGEVGGFLDTVLLQLAANYEAEVKLRGKVKAALTYPVVVLVLAALMCTGMLLFIVPTFATMFSDLGGELPLPTKALLVLSDLLWVAALPLVVVGVGGLVTWRRVKDDARVRGVVDPLKLRAPVFGPLFSKIALARFCRNLGTMMSSGVPILQSLEIASETTGNVVLTRAVRDVQESVRTGRPLAEPLGAHPVFPSMVVQMLTVGEDTGALDEMLKKISEFYDQEVEATTESLTALIEPLLIAGLGGVVGAMILALYMPIFGVFDLIQ